MRDEKQPSDSERRRYFRVPDHVHLRYRPVPVDEYQQRINSPQEEHPGGPCDLVLQLHALTQQGSNMLAGIRKSNPELAHYLTLQDRKMELLAQAVVGDALDDARAPNAHVDLSASGLTFDSGEPLTAGSYLELRLVLFPGRLCIQTLAQVVHASTAPVAPDLHRIGVEFTGLSEVAQDALFRHTLARQSMLRRRERDREGR